jgi:dipeptidyl aminopeptidase/acylaminoacyl peptidase
LNKLFRRTGVLFWLALSTAAWSAENPGQPVPHTFEELFRPPRISDASLSPNGQHVAIAYRENDKATDVVLIIDASRLGRDDSTRKVTVYEPGRVHLEWAGWATDSRLLIGARIRADFEMIALGFKPEMRIELPFLRRVIAIDADGKNAVPLFSDAKRVMRRNWDLSEVVDYTPDDPEHVLMGAWSGTSNDLYQVNVFTGSASRIQRGTSNTLGWVTEDGRPVLRYDANRRQTVLSIYGRDPEDEDDWNLITRYRRKHDLQDWEYAGDAPGAGNIYVRAHREGADTGGIYTFNLLTKSLGELVAQDATYDMRQPLLIDGAYAGATFIGDRLMYVMQDKNLQRHLKALDVYFNREANLYVQGLNRDKTWMLLHVFGPRAPGDYYLYDIKAAQVHFLISERPWLQPEKLAAVDTVRTPTRDGASITSYLTRPAGRTGPLPLVVMPHGGPEMRDWMTFDPIAQALATQGWLVLQPNFRGSSGYGRKFAEAGYRQWSKRMQDDVTDAVKDLVARGVADEKRIAIVGASYGGYAALTAAFVTPDAYRAAVSVAGIGDLMAMLDYDRREDGDDSESYQYWVRSIGDPKLDAVELKAASPQYNVDRIRIPILLAHGTDDDNVPVTQSREMARALEKAGKSVRLVEFPDENHDDWSKENWVKLMDEVAAFLKPVLDPPAAKALDSPAPAATAPATTP